MGSGVHRGLRVELAGGAFAQGFRVGHIAPEGGNLAHNLGFHYLGNAEQGAVVHGLRLGFNQANLGQGGGVGRAPGVVVVAGGGVVQLHAEVLTVGSGEVSGPDARQAGCFAAHEEAFAQLGSGELLVGGGIEGGIGVDVVAIDELVAAAQRQAECGQQGVMFDIFHGRDSPRIT